MTRTERATTRSVRDTHDVCMLPLQITHCPAMRTLRACRPLRCSCCCARPSGARSDSVVVAGHSPKTRRTVLGKPLNCGHGAIRRVEGGWGGCFIAGRGGMSGSNPAAQSTADAVKRGFCGDGSVGLSGSCGVCGVWGVFAALRGETEGYPLKTNVSLGIT